MNNTKQITSEQKESTLDPEIKKQAQKLFGLIEEHIEEIGPDETAEAIAEEMGDFLKNSDGFRDLAFGHELAKTKSERTIQTLEGVLWNIRDKDLSELHQLTKGAVEVVELIEDFDQSSSLKLEYRIKKIKEVGPDINALISSEWEMRARSYQSEIKKMQKAG